MEMDNGNRTMKNSSKGQSIVEYIILLAVLIAALIAFLGPGSMLEQSYQQVIDTQGTDLSNMSQKIFY